MASHHAGSKNLAGRDLLLNSFFPLSYRSNFLLLGKPKFHYVFTKSGHVALSEFSLIPSFLHTVLSKILFNIIPQYALRLLTWTFTGNSPTLMYLFLLP